MRNRWEDVSGSDLDAPAAITERELRSLRRRTRVGVIAMFLALLTTGAVGYTVFAGVEGLQGLRERLGLERGAPAVEQSATPSGPEMGTGAMVPQNAGTPPAAAATTDTIPTPPKPIPAGQ